MTEATVLSREECLDGPLTSLVSGGDIPGVVGATTRVLTAQIMSVQVPGVKYHYEVRVTAVPIEDAPPPQP